MPKAPRTRFFIANGGCARWVERRDGHRDLHTLGALTFDAMQPHSKPATLVFESAGGGRRSVGERDEAQRRLKAFAKEIADTINLQHRGGEFQRLGLIAPPRLLAAVKRMLDPAAAACLRFELPKDLTKEPDHTLRAWVHSPEIL